MRKLMWLLPLLWIGMAQADDISKLQNEIQKSLPGVTIENLAPVKGTPLYQAEVNDQLLYFTADGRYAIQGDLISLKDRTNLTELANMQIRKRLLAKVDESKMIIFGPKTAKYTVTVFTDMTCGYCRKLHSQMKQYNDLGIRIRYMAFPRSGLNKAAYYDAVNVWCAKDKNQAMTDGFNGKQVAKNHCSNNPVASDYKLGQRLGVQGTPAIFFESGQLLPGYLPPKSLKAVLDKASQS